MSVISYHYKSVTVEDSEQSLAGLQELYDKGWEPFMQSCIRDGSGRFQTNGKVLITLRLEK